MAYRRAISLCASLAAFAILTCFAVARGVSAAGAVQTPDQFIGFKVGADNKLARWDTIVAYMKQVASTSDRVRLREIGPTTSGNPFIVLEISSADNIKNLDRFKELQRKLYFQGGPPSARDRDDIFRQGKAVVFITCSVHATEIGATQMSMELVHRLATDDSPSIKKILDNVIVVLVPSANPDGQILVTDWFNRNLGTPFESSPLPYLYHPYVGHDNNRDMYAFTQKESQYTAQIAWHDWLPSIWLDEHQMGQTGPRIFVMPATDPINPNVHPLIYRWNAILGQSQAAALEAAGKTGIIYNATFTNFWQGAMAWSGWWHNQIGLLTEVASVRVASPTDQQHPLPANYMLMPPGLGSGAAGITPGTGRGSSGDVRQTTPLSPPASVPRGPAGIADGGVNPVSAISSTGVLPPPTDTTSRTEYPRPWLGGRWTLRDIVDYELISTIGLLETSADRRETILRQIYEVNRQTIEDGRTGEVSAIVVPVENQQDAREAAHLVERLDMAGVEVHRADAAFESSGQRYAAGTFVIPMAQVFARYAKDLLEKQVYPEVRRGPGDAVEPPYDVTAWSLGMQFGVRVDFLKTPLPGSLKLTRVEGLPKLPGRVTGTGERFTFPYRGADTATAINRLLKDGASVALDSQSRVRVSNIGRERIDALARDLGLAVTASNNAEVTTDRPAAETPKLMPIRAPRIALYSPWTGTSMDEGWTRWVLEQYEFALTTVHNADFATPNLKQRFDVIVLPDQNPREIVEGLTSSSVRPEFRGGIGDGGVVNLQQFIADGGTLVALGAACDFAIDRLPIPVRDLKRPLSREEHSAPGAILRIQVDTSHPVGYGTAADTFGFYNNSPFFSLVEGFTSQRTTVVARYPNQDVVASGWLKGEELMVGRAAVVSVEMNPGRVVLFGLRPQHRAQTHATFPMLFNSLYLSTSPGLPSSN